ncbi:MAG TPA: hypothetical protein DCY02_02980 [Armatimonadetes bacterium]|nr:hypothetical protein [Armatimonadota bacterium]HCM74379.1 hypothetical protein [Armatimonadota bacterium]
MTARIEVDPVTNKVKVTNLDSEGRAIWQGNSVKIESAEVFQLPGSSISSRVLRLTFKNNTQIPLGQNETLKAMLTTASSEFSAMTEAGIGSSGLTDGAVASAAIGAPRAVWEDADGTIYVAQGSSNGIRRIRNGSVSTIGSGYQNVFGITGDPSGNYIYFIERDRHRIIKLKKDGTEGSVLAGGPAAGDGLGTGASILFNTPTGITFGDNELFVADLGNNKVKRVSNLSGTPTVSLVASGIPSAYGISYGTIQGAPILGVTSNSTGQVFAINPLNNTSALIRTLAGGATGIAVSEGRFAVANNVTDTITVLRVPNGSNPYVLASWAQEYVSPGPAGFKDGLNPTANDPLLASPGNGNGFLFADTNNHRVRRLILPNFVSGSSTQPVTFSNEEWTTSSGRAVYTVGSMLPNSTKTLDIGFTVQFEASMTFYVTVAGGGVAPIALDGGTNAPPSNVYARVLAGGKFSGTVDGAGPAAAISGVSLKGIDVTPGGAVVFGDDNQLRRYSPADGVITTIGNVTDGTTPTDGTGFTAQFPGLIRAVAFMDTSTVLFASQNQLWIGSGSFNHPTRLGAGSFGFSRIGGASDDASGSVLGDGNTARFNAISAIAYDSNANAIYLIDRGNTRVLVGRQTGSNQFSPTSWTFSLVAGSTAGFADGTGAAAQFSNPDGLALGDDNALYVGDNFNNRLRRINLENQAVTTVAGDGSNGVVDGTPGRFSDIRSVVSDGAGSIYMNDFSRLRVYRNGRLYTISTGNNSLLGDGYTDGAGQQGSNRLAINRATGTIYTIGSSSSDVPQLVVYEAVVP